MDKVTRKVLERPVWNMFRASWPGQNIKSKRKTLARVQLAKSEERRAKSEERRAEGEAGSEKRESAARLDLLPVESLLSES